MYTLAISRRTPSIWTSLSEVERGNAITEGFSCDDDRPHHETQTRMSALLDVSGLTVRYGGVVAVDAVDVAVQEGAVFGLIGPNGAGKTSMVDALTGYTKPAAGRVEFDGRDITRLRPYKRARMRLARTFQSIELFDDLTVDENLLVASEHVNVGTALRDIFMPHRPPDRRGVDWAISVCGLEDVVDRFPSEISHGKRKLVGVGRALALEPRLVLLDEPAAGLDTDESLELGQKLQAMPREHGVTVFLIDHDMGLVLSVCDQLMVLDFGKQIASGTPTEIRQNQDVIEAYLGTRHGDDSD